MAFSENIFILSGDTGCGKTTLLSEWASKTADVGGIISPKIDGIRHFLNIESGEKRAMETPEATLKVGRYMFDEAAFQWASEELYNQFLSEFNWIIIDEIGPLELNRKQGFHNLINKLLSDNTPNRPKLLFVVRASLVQQFVDFYQLGEAKVLPKSFFANNQTLALTGIVLSGGESKRMKTDKALLQYHGKPQWQAVQQMLKPFCDEVVVSVNDKQFHSWKGDDDDLFCVDKDKYKNNGPLTGILSSMDGKDTGCFVVAVDYPLLKVEHLITLYNARNREYEAVCFTVKGRTEPLVSIFEEKAVAKMKLYFEGGGSSVNMFLSEIRTLAVPVNDDRFLLNINSVEEFLTFNMDSEKQPKNADPNEPYKYPEHNGKRGNHQ